MFSFLPLTKKRGFTGPLKRKKRICLIQKLTICYQKIVGDITIINGALRPVRCIKKIIVHCSASDEPHDANDIHLWHLARGWDSIGYHIIIEKDGIALGRDINKIGAHCLGENIDSIGICVIGEYEFNELQLSLLRSIIDILLSVYNLTKEDVYNHSDFNPNKTCPNFDVKHIEDL